MSPSINQNIKDFNKAAVNVLCMYFTLTEPDFYYCRLGELRVLQDLFLTEHKTLMQGSDDDYENGIWWPHIHGPDICGTCYTYYGHTRGGRVRQGCSACMDNTAHPIAYIYGVRDIFYINDAHCEYLMACALHLWSSWKERKQARRIVLSAIEEGVTECL